ncbi:MAG: Wzz/FepE/Etk N-terminal domain-containing protein, partial [Planctomycetota bacterium]
MTTANSEAVSPAEVLAALVRHRRVWIASTVAFAVGSLVYALFMTRYWEASQGLVVRQEAVGAEHGRAGKFNDLYEMRTLQETILELAKSRQVLEATLHVVNRSEGEDAQPFGDEEIEQLRRRIKMLPPYGAEFGKTEVFYLTVKDADQQRAILLVSELCNQLEVRLRQLRTDRAGSLAAELMQQVALAEQSHAKQTAALKEFE